MNFAINKWDNMNYSHINMDKSSTRLLRPWDFPGKSGVPVLSPKEYIEWYYLNKTKKQRRQNNTLFKEISIQVVKIIKNAKKKKIQHKIQNSIGLAKKMLQKNPKELFGQNQIVIFGEEKAKTRSVKGPRGCKGTGNVLLFKIWLIGTYDHSGKEGG